MKTCVRKALDYWIPPKTDEDHDCPVCEGSRHWSYYILDGVPLQRDKTLVHAPECPTQADPIAVARFFAFLVWLQSILTPAPIQEYLGWPWQTPPQRRGGL